MCGRYVVYDRLTKGDMLLLGQQIPANYNVAPTATVPIVRLNAAGTEQTLVMARWGLIPRWAKDLKIPPYFNARADTLAGNKVFGPFIQQPCLVPMAAFYEWSEQDKQPYLIRVIDEPIAYAAGIWRHWQSPGGQAIDSCAIITTQPNATLADIHHRMPVLLNDSDQATWLTEPFDHSKQVLQPYTQPMEKYPVNPKVVNNARNNTVHCLDEWHGEA